MPRQPIKPSKTKALEYVRLPRALTTEDPAVEGEMQLVSIENPKGDDAVVMRILVDRRGGAFLKIIERPLRTASPGFLATLAKIEERWNAFTTILGASHLTAEGLQTIHGQVRPMTERALRALTAVAALRAAFPWFEEEEISGADVIDYLTSTFSDDGREDFFPEVQA